MSEEYVSEVDECEECGESYVKVDVERDFPLGVAVEIGSAFYIQVRKEDTIQSIEKLMDMRFESEKEHVSSFSRELGKHFYVDELVRALDTPAYLINFVNKLNDCKHSINEFSNNYMALQGLKRGEYDNLIFFLRWDPELEKDVPVLTDLQTLETIIQQDLEMELVKKKTKELRENKEYMDRLEGIYQ